MPIVLQHLDTLVTNFRSLSAAVLARSVQRTPSKLSLVNYSRPSSLIVGSYENSPNNVTPILNPLANGLFDGRHQHLHRPEMSVFGIDLDAPVFWNIPYGKGGMDGGTSSPPGLLPVGPNKSRKNKNKKKRKSDDPNHLQVLSNSFYLNINT